VNALVRLPCQIIRTSRKLVYRLLSWPSWQPVFFRMLSVLRCGGQASRSRRPDAPIRPGRAGDRAGRKVPYGSTDTRAERNCLFKAARSRYAPFGTHSGASLAPETSLV
jgi:hypothetical protein